MLPSWLNLQPVTSDMAEAEPAAAAAADDSLGGVESDMAASPDHAEPGNVREPQLQHVAVDSDPEDEASAKFVYRFALPIPGMLHIIHNLCRDMHSVLPKWPELWGQLKNFEQLLSKSYRRKRLITTCVLDAACDVSRATAQLEAFSCTLYEQRWGCVTAFAAKLQPLLPLLAAAATGMERGQISEQRRHRRRASRRGRGWVVFRSC